MENLGWGLHVSALGMGLVFGLLVLLWGLLALVMRLDRPSPEATTAAGAARPATDADAAKERGMDDGLAAAILVAVLAHKAWRRQEAAPLMRSFWPGSLLYASRWVASGRMRQNRTWQRGRS